jgi:hypothetical protein
MKETSMQKQKWAAWCASLALAMALSATGYAETQRLEVSGNQRFLVKENGTPFFWLGDTNWRLYKLTQGEIDTYLANRAQKKFTVIQGCVLLISDSDPDAYNPYGQTNNDPNNPNEAWFEHIDYIVDKADELGLYMALVVTWGYNWDHFGDDQETREDNARAFGEWLGDRYKNRDNIIWIVAGEFAVDGLGSNVTSVWKQLGKGLKEGSNGHHLVTVHGSYQEGTQSSSVAFQNATWLDFNMIQSSQSGFDGQGSKNWKLVTTDYKKNPKKPTLDGEAHYENLWGWDAFGVRRRAYWSVFAGGFGYTYGCNGVFQSYRGGADDAEGAPQATWDQSLSTEGAGDMKFLRRLMESRPMLHRVPSQSMLATEAGSGLEHIQVTRDSNDRFAMIYVPAPNKTFSVDLTRISGSTAKAWWYNPRNGNASLIGSYSTNQIKEFTTPSSGTDWVLVIDDKSKGYPAPGNGGPLP